MLAALEAGAVDFLQKPTALATDRLLEVADELVAKVKAAAENTGFFYVKNHGIPESTIRNAMDRVKTFFGQSLEEKEEILASKCGRAGGYHGVRSTQINRTETAGM